jgi:hypothetical protein
MRQPPDAPIPEENFEAQVETFLAEDDPERGGSEPAKLMRRYGSEVPGVTWWWA